MAKNKFELAKAYIQIIPSMQGVKGQLKIPAPKVEDTGEAEGAKWVGKFKGKAVGLMKHAGIAAAAALATAFAATVTASFKEGAALEQSLGGVETMFGVHAEKLKAYATQAYKTAGVSANSYMEQVTSFSASLIQSLGGDTKQAVEVANIAMVDMSDNANKFGTDMQSIQDAYQGFAKGNFSMLDNLKIGYGGTQAEMQRLIDKANELRAKQGESANLSIDSFSDIVLAIHEVQEELGIAGTTGKEAATTLSGSWGQLKASFQDFLGALALGENSPFTLEDTINNMIESAKVFLSDNLLPMMASIVTGLIESLMNAVENLDFVKLGEIWGRFVAKFWSAAVVLAPVITKLALTIISHLIIGLMMGIGEIAMSAWEIIKAFIAGIKEKFIDIKNSASELIRNFIDRIKEKYTDIIESAKEGVRQFGEGIRAKLGIIAEKGREIIKNLKSGIINFVPNLISYIPELVAKIANKLISIVGKAKDIGSNLVKGLWNGIKNVKNWILDKIRGFGDSILSSLKDFFGIHSPSRLMRDEIGNNIAFGIGIGFSDNIDRVTKDIEKSLPNVSALQEKIQGGDFNVIGAEQRYSDDDLPLLLRELILTLKSTNIHHTTELDGKTIAEIIYPLIDALMSKDTKLQMRGV